MWTLMIDISLQALQAGVLGPTKNMVGMFD